MNMELTITVKIDGLDRLTRALERERFTSEDAEVLYKIQRRLAHFVVRLEALDAKTPAVK